MRRTLKPIAHGLTRTDPGWLLLRQAASLSASPAAHEKIAILAAPPTAFEPGHRVRVVHDGAIFELDRSNYFQWARSLGLFDRVGQVLRHLAPPSGAAFWDVGANVGYYSVLMSRWSSAVTPIVAIEPGSAAARQLRRHLEINGVSSATVVSKAVADAPSSAVLFGHDSGDVGKASLRRDMGSTGETVEVSTIDRVWEGLGRGPVRLMKIDVEGLEGEVLIGARALIASERPDLVVEISPAFHAPDKVREALGLLRDLDYRWADIDRFLGSPDDMSPISEGGLSLSAQTDVVFRPASRATA